MDALKQSTTGMNLLSNGLLRATIVRYILETNYSAFEYRLDESVAVRLGPQLKSGLAVFYRPVHFLVLGARSTSSPSKN